MANRAGESGPREGGFESQPTDLVAFEGDRSIRLWANSTYPIRCLQTLAPSHPPTFLYPSPPKLPPLSPTSNTQSYLLLGFLADIPTCTFTRLATLRARAMNIQSNGDEPPTATPLPSPSPSVNSKAPRPTLSRSKTIRGVSKNSKAKSRAKAK
eukprot:1394914-Amorphochlora_amoeboformis.AAC.1